MNNPAPEPVPSHLVDDPVEERRESMIDILASWDLDGARPDATGMQIVSSYVDGKISLGDALAAVDRRVEQFREEQALTTAHGSPDRIYYEDQAQSSDAD